MDNIHSLVSVICAKLVYTLYILSLCAFQIKQDYIWCESKMYSKLNLVAVNILDEPHYMFMVWSFNI